MSTTQPTRVSSYVGVLLAVWALAGCAARAPSAAPEPKAAQAPAPAPEPVPDTARILEWEDRRALGELQVLTLSAQDPKLRARALRALGRIQDPAGLDAILAGLADPEALVRDEAAFAAGELALSWEPLEDDVKARLTQALTGAEPREQDGRVRLTLLESLGKLSTPGALAHLARSAAGPGASPLTACATLSLGVAARKGATLPAETLAPATALPAQGLPLASRYAGAYLLSQAKRPEAATALLSCLSDEDADVRGVCVKGLAEAGVPADVPRIAPLLADPAPRVAAEAARTLARRAAACTGPCRAREALAQLAARAPQVAAGDSAAGHPLLALAQAGLSAKGGVLGQLRAALKAALPQAQGTGAADLGNLDCRLAAAQDRQSGRLDQVRSCGFGQVPGSRRLALGLREVAQGPTPDVRPVLEALSHADAGVRLAALELAAVQPRPEWLPRLRELLSGADPIEAAAAAGVAAKLKDPASLPLVRALAAKVPQTPDIAEPVGTALTAFMGRAAEPELRPWLQSPDANVRHVAARLLTEVGGVRVAAGQVVRPESAPRPQPAPAGAQLVFRTEKGTFRVALDAQEAPLTAGNLYALAQKGYFNGLRFHRVVPDFVAQGGDPRGDGEGGPGYSIRCEMTRRPYARGVLGMALSGKDTGGSQFFFTHAPQPHLDGRYTAFGEVVEGMDVVDRLLEGDTMLEVRAEVAPGRAAAR
jgi:cyclophilin family peptidyl-prolyl cis-trans isomerase/HEAT repeat protein